MIQNLLADGSDKNFGQSSLASIFFADVHVIPMADYTGTNSEANRQSLLEKQREQMLQQFALQRSQIEKVVNWWWVVG